MTQRDEMPRTMRYTGLRRVACTVVLVSVAACGGGGGSGGSDAGGVVSPPVAPGPVTTGLVPTPPALGAVLETDAARLRVLRAGATWRYSGVLRNAGEVARAYSNVVTHTAAAVGVQEAGTNPLGEGPDTQALRIEEGAVRVALPLNELGVTRAIDIVELRGPVRVGDQITQFDERVADAVADVDSDGRREALDLAIWTRVIGTETVDLVLRPGLRAVRVETTVAVRLRPSAPNALVQPVVTSVQQSWYAPGIGLVQTRSETPSATLQGVTDVAVEQLDSWDGITEGLGALPPVTPRLPTGNVALGAPISAVAFSSHGVVLVPGQMPAVANGDPLLVNIDALGSVTASYPIRIDGFSTDLGPGNLVRVGDGLRLVTRVVGANPGVVMTSYASSGQPTGAAPVRLIEGLPLAPGLTAQPEVVVVGTTSRLWLMWLRRPVSASPAAPLSAELVLQGFSPDGTPVSPPRVLSARTDLRDILAFSMAANATNVLVSWGVLGEQRPYAVFDAATGNEVTRKLATALPDSLLAGVPLAADGLLALGWSVINPPGAMLLDAGFNAVPSTAAGWQGDTFPQTPELGLLSSLLVPTADGWLLQGYQTVLREPVNNNTLTTLTLITMPAGTGALTTRPLTTQVRLPISSGVPVIEPAVLVFADRLLIYGRSNAGTLVTIPVWRRN